ncbi:MAG: Nif3-like dinuclear metal center hexameric protein [Kiritimatiellae bacterium]|nr:Nif3-like dinuclear metal center hexameric protein [Kiritimatiellia bacterium]
MRAREIHEHLQGLGPWVDWEKTNDVFLHGDPDVEVKAIATMWIPTTGTLRQAAEQGANLVISHEPMFFPGYTGKWRTTPYPGVLDTCAEKRAFLDELGLTVLRSHDVWDYVPDHGVIDSWAQFLGFPVVDKESPEILKQLKATGHDDEAVKASLKACRLLDVSGHTAATLAEAVLERIRPIGQEYLLIQGDDARPVTRMAIGTGAYTPLPLMVGQGADVLLATDDGIRTWDGSLWASDIDVPLMLVNHATAELPGIMSIAKYLGALYPDVPVFYVPHDMTYRARK